MGLGRSDSGVGQWGGIVVLRHQHCSIRADESKRRRCCSYRQCTRLHRQVEVDVNRRVDASNTCRLHLPSTSSIVDLQLQISWLAGNSASHAIRIKVEVTRNLNGEILQLYHPTQARQCSRRSIHKRGTCIEVKLPCADRFCTEEEITEVDDRSMSHYS
jgi:hypothetical protein